MATHVKEAHASSQNPTLSQSDAAHPERSSWVSASAGTGKTKILTDRVLSLLLTGARPHKILCLTFTKAGATEMTQRLMARLERWATVDEPTLYQEVAALVDPAPETLHRARRLFTQILDAPQGLTVQTIHSFCQSLLQRFPVEAGVAWAFSIADDATTKKLLTQAQEEALCDPELAPFIAPLVSTFGQTYFHELVESLFASFQADRQSLTHAPDLTLTKLLKVSPYDTPESLLARTITPTRIRALVSPHIHHLEGGGKEDQGRAQALHAYLSLVNPNVLDFLTLSKSFLTAQGEVRARLASKAVVLKDPLLLDNLTTLAQEMMQAVHLLRAHHICQVSHGFFRFFIGVMLRFQALKDGAFLLDYDDLIDKACALLHDPDVSDWVRFRMDGGLDHILVDEAQDTNGRQWALVEALSQEFFSGEGTRSAPATLFAVGDVKQSIYRFQGAMPHLFEHMRTSFASRVTFAGLPWQDIGMNVSYRSTSAVLSLVDQVFDGPSSHGVRSLERDPLPHIPHRQGSPGLVEIWPLEVGEDACDDDAESDNIDRPDRRLAQKLAQHIHTLLAHPPLMSSTNKGLRASDILVLVQRRSPFVAYLTRALKDLHIPVAGEDRLSLTRHLAVQDMLALAQFMLLPQDDFTLACLLKSPLVGLDEDSLMSLAVGREGSLWQELVRQQSDAPHLERAHTFLAEFLRRADQTDPLELFTHALYDLGRMGAFRARFGASVEEVLQEFLALTQKDAARFGPSLQGFLGRLQEEDIILKRDFAANESNEIRIMTVHGSKGLQAPFVILPDTTISPSLKENFIWQEGVCVWLAPQDQDTPTLRSLKARPLSLTEEDSNRLLYVALTRAQDRLLICGWEGARASKESSWYARVRCALGEKTHLGEMPPLAASDTAPPFHTMPALTQAPPWLNTPLVREYDPFASTSTPSSSETESAHEEARLFGEVLHHLLEWLPTLHESERPARAEVFAGTSTLPKEEQQRLVETALRLLSAPHLAHLFDAHALREVPVAGMADDTLIRGRVDLLVSRGDEIMIIDFKSSRHPPKEIPQAYVAQLASYRRLLVPLYPDKRLTTWILWTHTGALQEI
ncbi:MAG: double-strand break repair helicase AddA [Candidatus Puniceispirillum sp.]|nr:double-strand break repair helicase AddA [Candidatus Puniceispirillum sp.]